MAKKGETGSRDPAQMGLVYRGIEIRPKWVKFRSVPQKFAGFNIVDARQGELTVAQAESHDIAKTTVDAYLEKCAQLSH